MVSPGTCPRKETFSSRLRLRTLSSRADPRSPSPNDGQVRLDVGHCVGQVFDPLVVDQSPDEEEDRPVARDRQVEIWTLVITVLVRVDAERNDPTLLGVRAEEFGLLDQPGLRDVDPVGVREKAIEDGSIRLEGFGLADDVVVVGGDRLRARGPSQDVRCDRERVRQMMVNEVRVGGRCAKVKRKRRCDRNRQQLSEARHLRDTDVIV